MTIRDETILKDATEKKAWSGPEILQVPVLDKKVCRAYGEAVLSLRQNWIRRESRAPFFTLGGASYLDAPNGGFPAYAALAERFNPLLDEHFSPLYRQFIDCLEKALGDPVYFDPRLCRPGFHIYLKDEAFAQDVASVHFDRQHECIDWLGEALIGDHTVQTVTLPLMGAENGSGIRFWDMKSEREGKMAPVVRMLLMGAAESVVCPYEDGTAFLHSGQDLHQAVLMDDIESGGPRITLQGHLFRTRRGWCLYW